jgi:hypothetical protein
METARKRELLADELQLLTREIGGHAFGEAWSEATDAFLIARRAADLIRAELAP